MTSNEQPRRNQLNKFENSGKSGQIDLPLSDSEDWTRLQSDFAKPGLSILAFDELPKDLVQYARQYIRLRRRADDLRAECDRIHLRIASEGLQPNLVEQYARARDAFEECVEAFGKSREKLELNFR